MSARNDVGIAVFIELLTEYEPLATGSVAGQHNLCFVEVVHCLGKCKRFVEKLDDLFNCMLYIKFPYLRFSVDPGIRGTP